MKNQELPMKKNFVATKSISVEGRRVINIEALKKGLYCSNCKKELSLSNIVNETPRGLASIFSIICGLCGTITTVPTDTKHSVSEKFHYDTNTKALMGALNAGMGITQLNKLLVSLNVPAMSWNTYKNHETEVGSALEKMAKISCINAALQERTLSEENMDQMNILL